MLAPSIKAREVACVNTKDEWMDPIKVYLKNETLFEDKRQVKKI